jgi:gliding motility-associated-like protein
MWSRIVLVACALLAMRVAQAQSDGCSFAPSLPVTANCSSPTAGTSAGATQTIPGCTGNADDDVWYQFTATQTSHQIRVVPSGGYDPVLQVFSGVCSSLVSMGCKDDNGTGVEEVFNGSNFVPGQVYRMRVYHYGVGWGTGTFTICVTTPPAAPANDNCAGAQLLTVNSTCVPVNSTTNGATQSLPGCAGNADDDVWFRFVATNAVQTITVNPLSNLDLVVQLYTGSCGSLTSLVCMDNTFSGSQEVINAVGLVPGQTYYVRVYDYYTGNTGNFSICVTGQPTAAPTNDEPCNAILMPAVTSACNYASFTNVGATASTGPGIPTPFSCIGGSGAAIGGFNSGTADVWFKIVVPSSGTIHITSQPNMGPGRISDGVMALYSGTCASLTQLVCADDHNYPGTGNDLLPMISQSGLTPGDTLYLRYWGFNTQQGSFGFCVTTATNDDCVNALYICDINGYSASTGAYYTPDRPCNMRGNAEQNNPPTYTYTPGTNTGGIFGQAGPWGSGASAFDVRIDNNSWIRFTAAASTAVLNVSVYDCWIGNYPSGGIQMQVFAGNGCCDFVPVSNFEENSTGFTITANNLTPGYDYYLMVDGFAGDICNYTISAESGVQFPDIADVAPICSGGTVTLTAPPGATSYLWTHSGETTQSVTVSPATTMTYYCEVSGLCDYKQMLDVEVQVIPLPDITLSTGSTAAICAGSSIQITASGASTYSWSTGQSGAQITVSPGSTTTYIVTGTQNGCQNTAQVQVQVNGLPQLTVAPSSSDADCGLSNGALTGTVITGSPTLSYSWTNSGGTVVGNSVNLNSIPAGLYTLHVTDGNGCQNSFGPFGVSNPGAPPAPQISVSANQVCLGEEVQVSVTSTEPGADFQWSGPAGFNSAQPSFVLDFNQINQAGNYCVTATVANCTGPAACVNLSINLPPELLVSSDANGQVICEGSSVSLTVSGATNYSWTGPQNFTANGNVVVIDNLTPSMSGWYVVSGTDGNGCTSLDSVQVQVVSGPNAQATATGVVTNTVCSGGNVQLNATGGLTYSWSGPNGFASNAQNPTFVDFQPNQSGLYTVTVTDVNGCVDEADVTLAISQFGGPELIASDTVLCPGETLVLTATGAVSYSWSGPDGFMGSGAVQTITNISLSQSGVYIVVGVDEYGCDGVDSVNILVTQKGDCLFIPELVTPNGDNMNDVWVIQGIENYPKASVSIFNRWGNLIFTASPYENDWFGQVNKGVNMGDGSGKVPPGTYFFLIELNDGETEPIKGYLELQY